MKHIDYYINGIALDDIKTLENVIKCLEPGEYNITVMVEDE